MWLTAIRVGSSLTMSEQSKCIKKPIPPVGKRRRPEPPPPYNSKKVELRNASYLDTHKPRRSSSVELDFETVDSWFGKASAGKEHRAGLELESDNPKMKLRRSKSDNPSIDRGMGAILKQPADNIQESKDSTTTLVQRETSKSSITKQRSDSRDYLDMSSPPDSVQKLSPPPTVNFPVNRDVAASVPLGDIHNKPAFRSVKKDIGIDIDQRPPAKVPSIFTEPEIHVNGGTLAAQDDDDAYDYVRSLAQLGVRAANRRHHTKSGPSIYEDEEYVDTNQLLQDTTLPSKLFRSVTPQPFPTQNTHTLPARPHSVNQMRHDSSSSEEDYY